jgi:RecA-family ATPase
MGVFSDIKKTGARVVIIDTFGAFVTVKDGNEYHETTARIREIKRIADTMNVAIIVVHHSRKSSAGKKSDDWTSEILGSQGLIGASDNIISLQRERGKDAAKLIITGRDISDCFIDLQWDDGIWKKSG